VVSGYVLTYGGFLLLGGCAADLLGRRRILVAGLSLFAIASLVGGTVWVPEIQIPVASDRGRLTIPPIPRSRRPRRTQRDLVVARACN
jgi:MFS family permease